MKTHLFKLEVCQPRIYLFMLVFEEFLWKLKLIF